MRYIRLLLVISSATVILSGNFTPLFAAENKAPPPIDTKKAKKDLTQAGKLYYRQNKFDAAIQKWEEALAIDPGDKKVKKYIQDARKKLESQTKKESKKKKKVSFNKEIGLINVTAPPKEMLTTFSLDDCIKIAMANNLPMQIAKKSVKLAEMRVNEARRNMLPSATIAFEEGTGRVNDRRYISRKQYVEGQQPVFHGGELYFTMKQTGVNLEITKNDYKRIRNDLILQVKKGYYSLARAKENYLLQKDLAEEVDKRFAMAAKELEAGIASKIEFLNVSSQYSQVQYQFASAEGDVDVAELILKQAMNLDTKEKVDIEPTLEFKKVEIDFEEALKVAFANRPEIRINTLMLEYYDYGRRISKAKGWPKIDIMGQWGLAKDEYASSDQNKNPAGPDDNRKMEQQWYAGLKASMPFWGSTGEYAWTREQWVPAVSVYQGTESDTNSYKFKILDKLDYYSDRQLADIEYDRIRQEFNKVKQDVTLELKESCFGYEKALIQLKTALDKMKYQEKDLELVKLKRELDEVQDASVIESTIKLAQEKFGYVQALADCHISLAGVNKAIGVEDYFKDEVVTKK